MAIKSLNQRLAVFLLLPLAALRGGHPRNTGILRSLHEKKQLLRQSRVRERVKFVTSAGAGYLRKGKWIFERENKIHG